MEIFWGVLFGGIAALVLVWLLTQVILAERWGEGPEFTSSEPERTHADLEKHLERWDRSREDELP